jgi:hypothetical protein
MIRGGDAQHVSGSEGRPPPHNARRIDLIERAGISEGRAPILLLAAYVEHSTRVTGTVSPASIVKDQDRVTCLCEPLGVGGEAQGADRGESVRHDDDRRPLYAVRSV